VVHPTQTAVVFLVARSTSILRITVGGFMIAQTVKTQPFFLDYV